MMASIGAIGFLQPWFLAGLIALPILWWLLRATPPSPRRVRFPGVAVLLGLDDRERTPQRTPLWLLILRCLAVALLLAAFAEPILNPKARLAGDGPLLVVTDGGWGSAGDWTERRRAALDLITQAGESERPTAFVSLAADAPPLERVAFGEAQIAAEAVAALEPQPWGPDAKRLAPALAALGERLNAEGARLETVWIHDGLAHEGSTELAATLDDLGALRLIGPETPELALGPPEIRDGLMVLPVLRADAGPARTVRVAAFGAARAAEAVEGGPTGELGDAGPSESLDAAPDPAANEPGLERRLATVVATFAEGETRTEAEIDLPTALRNAISRFEILRQDFGGEGAAAHAGAVQLMDDRWRRRTVALVSGETGVASQPLLSGMHYLRAALTPHAAFREASLEDALGGKEAIHGGDGDKLGALAGWADAIVLADIGRIDDETEKALIRWVEAGGLLIRFAGGKLAALADEESGFSGRAPDERPLLPTRLRGGGRALGGALSWSTPQKLRPFPETSPFYGLEIPDEVTVSRQVLAEPGPELADRVWATLEDGTPLVTSKPLGEGRVALFHITASAAWSSLPLSGLFVEMMGRLVAAAPALNASEAALAEDSRSWTPVRLMDGYGHVAKASAEASPVLGSELAEGARRGVRPGVYSAETADGEIASLALSAIGSGETLAPRPPAPAGAVVETLQATGETPLKPWLLAAALTLFLLDVLAALLVAGRLRARPAAAALALVLAAAAFGAPPSAQAQASSGGAETANRNDERVDPADQRAALETVLAYVVTGDPQVDRTSAAGLLGLSATLFQRTAIEPGEAAGVDLETDELSVYAIMYWPITARQPNLSDEAVRKLNAYMRTGGLLVVDTRDAHQTFGSTEGPNTGHLRRLLSKLDLPPLERVRPEHVLTRTYYILDEMPGRWTGGSVWVEASRHQRLGPDADRRAAFEATANDGVSPIIIGAADWAAAWAIDDQGNSLFPLGRGGERQRENAYRFGVNMAMYAFTGNYKSDQVHIPALLDRLGN